MTEHTSAPTDPAMSKRPFYKRKPWGKANKDGKKQKLEDKPVETVTEAKEPST